MNDLKHQQMDFSKTFWIKDLNICEMTLLERYTSHFKANSRWSAGKSVWKGRKVHTHEKEILPIVNQSRLTPRPNRLKSTTRFSSSGQVAQVPNDGTLLSKNGQSWACSSFTEKNKNEFKYPEISAGRPNIQSDNCSKFNPPSIDLITESRFKDNHHIKSGSQMAKSEGIISSTSSSGYSSRLNTSQNVIRENNFSKETFRLPSKAREKSDVQNKREGHVDENNHKNHRKNRTLTKIANHETDSNVSNSDETFRLKSKNLKPLKTTNKTTNKNNEIDSNTVESFPNESTIEQSSTSRDFSSIKRNTKQCLKPLKIQETRNEKNEKNAHKKPRKEKNETSLSERSKHDKKDVKAKPLEENSAMFEEEARAVEPNTAGNQQKLKKTRKNTRPQKVESRTIVKETIENNKIYKKSQKRILKWMSRNYGRIIDIFKRFDVDGSGSLSMQEFCEGMKSMGAPGTEEELQMMAQVLDFDNDDSIDFEEFRKLKRYNRITEPRAGHATRSQKQRTRIQAVRSASSSPSPKATTQRDRTYTNSSEMTVDLAYKLQPCNKCCIGIEELPYYKNDRHISIRMTSISKVAHKWSPIGQFLLDVSPEMTIYGIERLTKAELGGSAINVRIFRKHGKKRGIEVLEQHKHLGDYGYKGNNTADKPEMITLFYDYTYPKLDCPLVSASLLG